MMPADWIAQLIKDWTKEGKVKKIESPGVYKASGATQSEQSELKSYFGMISGVKTHEEANALDTTIRDDEKLTGRQKWVLRTKLNEKRKEGLDGDIPF